MAGNGPETAAIGALRFTSRAAIRVAALRWHQNVISKVERRFDPS